MNESDRLARILDDLNDLDCRADALDESMVDETEDRHGAVTARIRAYILALNKRVRRLEAAAKAVDAKRIADLEALAAAGVCPECGKRERSQEHIGTPFSDCADPYHDAREVL